MYKGFLFSLYVILFLMFIDATTQSAAAAVLFNDDFNRTSGLGAAWTLYAGAFSTDGSAAVSTGGSNFAGVAAPLGTDDYLLESVLTIPSGAFYSGITARANPSTFTADQYAAQIAINGTVNLYRRNASVWTLLKSAPADIAAAVPYTLSLKVSGSSSVSLEVSLNGSLVLSYSDSSSSRLTSGIAGIENYNNGVKYDRFTVSSIGSATGNQAPTAQISAYPTSGPIPLTVHFDGSMSSDSDGKIVSYAWDFGDGTAGSQAILDHTYDATGSFAASLSVTDDQGAAANNSIQVAATTAGAVIPRFAYVANSGSSDVTEYTVDPSSGALTLIGSISSGSQPYALALDPKGRFAYTGNFAGASVSIYTIDSSRGILTGRGAVQTGPGPYSEVVDPTGNFLYAADEDSSTDIWTYRIDQSTGHPTLLGTAQAGVSPISIALDPTGKFAYVANNSSSNVSMFKINPTSGLLTRLGEVASGKNPASVAVHPSGAFAYVVNYSSNDVWSYSINASTGALTRVGTAPAGAHAFSAAVEPTGRFAYVANSGSGDVYIYKINQTTGALSLIGTIASGDGPRSAAVDPSGKFLYVANINSNNVTAFAINSGTGFLQVIGKYRAGTNPRSIRISSGQSSNQSPTARIAESPASGAAPLSVHFDGSGSSDTDGSISSYAWNFGDGTSGTGAVVNHTYSTAGSFTVALTVTDNQGASNSATQGIIVNPQGGPSFSDNFNRTNSTDLGSQWNEYITDFGIVGNQLQNTYGNGFPVAAVATTAIGPDQDISVDCKLSLSGNNCAIMARWSSDNNFYRVRMGVEQGNLVVFKTVGGTTTLLGSVSRTLQFNVFYRLRFVVNGTKLSVYFNNEGAPALTLTDSALTTGNYAGLRSFATQAATTYYDNFIVTQP